MTHDELLEAVNSPTYRQSRTLEHPYIALRAVVDLHYPTSVSWAYGLSYCMACSQWKGRNPHHLISYPCPTIQAIEKELK